ncbi:MAG: hypothetical protein ACE15C_07350 [Phycisphaerae bacterium]
MAMWLLGAATVALAIITMAAFLGSTAGRILMAVTVLVAATALLFESGVIVSRLSYLSEKTGVRQGESRFVRGLSAECLAGCAGIVLGILALVGYWPLLLTSAAVITFGGAIALGGLSRALTNAVATNPSLAEPPAESMNYLKLTRESSIIDAGGSLLAGIGTVAIGIVALLGVAPMALNVVGLLVVGSTVFLSASPINGAVVNVIEHEVLEFTRRHRELRRAA